MPDKTKKGQTRSNEAKKGQTTTEDPISYLIGTFYASTIKNSWANPLTAATRTHPSKMAIVPA